MQYLKHTDTKKLFVVYLKFKLTGQLIFLLAKSGNSIRRDEVKLMYLQTTILSNLKNWLTMNLPKNLC